MSTLDEFLKEFPLREINIDRNELAGFTSNFQFIEVGHPILKNLCQICIMIANIIMPDDENSSGYVKEDAILFGTFTRYSKLLILHMEEIGRLRQESVKIYKRCLTESFINLLYFIEFRESSTFKNFLKYSLREDKKIFSSVSENILAKGYSDHIEKRILDSIEKMYARTGYTLEEIKNSSNWPSIKERISKLENLKGMYEHAFSLESHSVHGNWQDLYFHHLYYENEKFYTKIDFTEPSFKEIPPVVLMTVWLLNHFLDSVLPEFKDSKEIKKLFDDCARQILEVREMHEYYLQQRIKFDS